MKNYLLLIVFLCTGMLYTETTEVPANKRHEFKIDIAYLFVPCLKIEYEFILSDEASLGAVCFWGSDNIDTQYQYLGFYRWYFGKEPISGFFLEGHVGFSRLLRSNSWYEWEDRYDTYMGAGFALGRKYVTKNGVVLDFFIGPGRVLNGESENEFYPRMGITLGKRF